ncbi:DUF4349 domain-containing protein [Psychrobacter sp. DAB_AL62B]|uniref:DUF4349 domain-containing protein n=1 Tax=Psychrobacter sp. DAB_AL62B TaxID=1028420 RepID=UPI00238150FB|nr:DUF4349 domain-containing protein [Psychrobacter sp. DAB_AL62B]MDE4454894.1 DUF4349 domain-containing protein [Psychrobacter sp. DAB_AL62B]
MIKPTADISKTGLDVKTIKPCEQNKCDASDSYKVVSFKTLVLPIVLPTILGSLIFIGGCSDSSEYAESSADMESVQSATEEATDNSEINGIMSDVAADSSDSSDSSDSADNTSNAKPTSNDLSIDNLSGDSEQTLGSQVADIQIAGKELLITASANFKVKDVVKSSAAIENLTRQQGGYVALSNISNHPNDSRTFVQDDKNITITTYTRQAEMTVRVPRVNINKFLAQLQPQVAFLNGQEFTAEDVTLDIYREKLASQLGSDMASELSQERLDSKNNKDQSSNVDAITATYAARRQQDLAKLEQMDIIDKVKYSTIRLTFMQPDISYKEITQNLDVLLDAERPSFGAQVKQAFKHGWEMLRSFVLGLIQLWWLVVLAGVLYLIYRMVKALYRKLFKNDAHLTNLKRELMDKNHVRKYSAELKENRVDDADNINNIDSTDSSDDKPSN